MTLNLVLVVIYVNHMELHGATDWGVFLDTFQQWFANEQAGCCRRYAKVGASRDEIVLGEDMPHRQVVCKVQ